MATIDIILLIVVVGAGIWGFSKGFIHQIGAIAAVIVGIIACRMLGPQAVELICPPGEADAFSSKHIGAVVMAYAVLYIVAYYAVLLVAKMLKLAVHTVFLGPLDRIAGALLNIGKCLIMLSFLLNVYMAIFPDSDLQKTSKIAEGKAVAMVIGLAPRIVGAVLPNQE